MKSLLYKMLCLILVGLFVAGGCAIDAVRLNRQAQVYIKYGRYDDAQKLLANSLDVDFENSASHYWLGSCYQAQGNLSKAIYEYDLAVRFDPAMELGQRSLIKALYIDNQSEKSLEATKVFLNQKTDYARDFLRLAHIFENEQMNQHAVLAYEKAQQIEPGNPGPSIALADFYMAQGQKEQAVQSLIKAFMIDPHYPGLARLLGEHHQRVEIPEPEPLHDRSDLRKELEALEN